MAVLFMSVSCAVTSQSDPSSDIGAQNTSVENTETKDKSGKKIYFAGPLFSHAEREYNLKMAELLESYGYEVFLPQRDGIMEPDMEGKDGDEIAAMIFEEDVREILNADIVFMILDGRVPDEGACVELGIAYANNKRCYGFKTDMRSAGQGLDLNPMISQCFIRIFKNTDGDKLIEEFKQYLAENEL